MTAARGRPVPFAMLADLEPAARALAKARAVVVLTGAGVSAESGVRTFRDTMEGLWKDFDPARLATPEAFADPETVTRWYDWRRQGCLAAEPNPAHLGLARLEREIGKRGGVFVLLTQNVDRLHQRAGSRGVVELHGSIVRWRCTRTGVRCTPGPEPFAEFPPRSEAGGLLRPDVVWFGEALPAEALDAAERAVAGCDCFLSIGTSSVVYPAAGFAEAAAGRGVPVIEVNPQPTALTARATWSLRGRAGEAVPALVEAAFGAHERGGHEGG